eukprot:Nitzschia sp. Nitz4//scaffold413_size9536//3507//4703//NITZ4_009095-RA/size9536-processed-gene-0.3-mRNA-1//1//CDS//3329551337//7860//frame0
MAKKRRHPSSQQVDENDKGTSTIEQGQTEATASSLSTSDNQANTTSTPRSPCRNTDHLLVCPPTLECAQHGCVPCAYKVGLFDVALDKEFCRQVPNQRPEQCPRLGRSSKKHTATSNHAASKESSFLGYQPGMSVLTVGDGDFSFSLAIARLLFSSSSSSKPSTLVATSYESEETLRRVYPDLDSILDELSTLGALVYYQVDATHLDTTLLPQLPKQLLPARWDRICWNFPCTAISSGQDGQNDAMEDNKALVRAFVANAIPMLRVPTKNGENAALSSSSSSWGDIHMCHKTKPPYDQWKLEQVAISSSLSRKESWIYRGRVVLDRALLPPYTPRKALDRKSFPCHDACIYMFGRDSIVTAQQLTSAYNILPVTSQEILALRNNLLRQKASSKKRKFR